MGTGTVNSHRILEMYAHKKGERGKEKYINARRKAEFDQQDF